MQPDSSGRGFRLCHTRLCCLEGFEHVDDTTMSQNRSVTPTALAGDFGRRMDADKIVIHSLERDEPTTFRLYAVRLFGAPYNNRENMCPAAAC